MRIFISGGCKNGKSYYAQRLAAAQVKHGDSSSASPESRGTVPMLHLPLHPLYYVATMKPVDAEDEARIARHREDREGWDFITVEQQTCIEGILGKCETHGSFLLDSLTALLANEMFPPDGRVNEQAAESITCGLTMIMDEIENIVIVSDYIYSDAIFYDHLTGKYRKSLAMLDRAAATQCDAVIEVAYTGVSVHKGSLAGFVV